MVVCAVDQNDVRRSSPERFGRRQPAESSTDDHDSGSSHVFPDLLQLPQMIPLVIFWDDAAGAHAEVAVRFVLVKSGGRFSKNAVIASLVSVERSCAENSSFSNFAACSSCWRKDCLISLLQACSALAGFSANFCAVSVAVASSFWSGTTRVTSPSSPARCASKGSPNSISSAARR